MTSQLSIRLAAAMREREDYHANSENFVRVVAAYSSTTLYYKGYVIADRHYSGGVTVMAEQIMRLYRGDQISNRVIKDRFRALGLDVEVKHYLDHDRVYVNAKAKYNSYIYIPPPEAKTRTVSCLPRV